jgi:ABC-type multidrug transport system fused ATPase/permease subunit
MSKAIVLSANEWNPENLKFMQPKVSSLGTKAISLISTQTNRSLHLSTPLMMTWGISDFVDEKGEGGGKYTMPLNFPSDDYRTQPTDDFLQKIQRFENVILDNLSFSVRRGEILGFLGPNGAGKTTTMKIITSF